MVLEFIRWTINDIPRLICLLIFFPIEIIEITAEWKMVRLTQIYVCPPSKGSNQNKFQHITIFWWKSKLSSKLITASRYCQGQMCAWERERVEGNFSIIKKNKLMSSRVQHRVVEVCGVWCTVTSHKSKQGFLASLQWEVEEVEEVEEGEEGDVVEVLLVWVSSLYCSSWLWSC